MADKLRNILGKKRDGKFKGKGHKLDESSSNQPKPKQPDAPHAPYEPPTEDARQAGLAALARLANTTGGCASKKVNSSFAYQHGKLDLESGPNSKMSEPKLPETLAVQGVFYKCPFVGPDVLPKAEWVARIRKHLYEQLEIDQGLNSSLMIHTFNKNKDKVMQCVDTLSTYLNNIMSHPEEEKYKKIRFSNKVFQERIASIEGALEYLYAAGFVKTTLPINDGEEDFLVFEGELDINHLEMLVDCLRSAEPIPLELDRNCAVLLYNQAASMLELPSEFFNLSSEELKREQKQRSDALESSMQLRTKAMREKEEQRELKRYKFSLIRIRFPDGLFLQGTFSVFETLESIKKFVRENISDENCEFELKSTLGQTLGVNDNEKTLLSLKLVPAVLLTFNQKSKGNPPASYLKQEVLNNVQII